MHGSIGMTSFELVLSIFLLCVVENDVRAYIYAPSLGNRMFGHVQRKLTTKQQTRMSLLSAPGLFDLASSPPIPIQWMLDVGVDLDEMMRPALPLALPLAFRQMKKVPTLQKQFEDAMSAKTVRERRAEMEEQADLSSKLALALYFEGISKVYEVEKRHAVDVAVETQRLNRKCPLSSERSSQAFTCNDNECEIDLEEVQEPYKMRLYKTFTNILRKEAAKKEQVDIPAAASDAPCGMTHCNGACMQQALQVSVAKTLDIIGVRNRIDSTRHEGKEYMDVIVEYGGMGHQGSQQQQTKIVFQTAKDVSSSYMMAKQRALQREGWVVISVQESEWKKLHCDAVRVEWVAQELVRCGFWHSKHDRL
uniref:RAP domain-containing protein n=1 Tax=Hanusia phi TaxID=3032 RepID=A0A7S0HQV3_9CRYP|mmetsp:Transcript_28723/g.65098  ORF Transcript_28723/g.65098 Transcript_28723/m.65098 type:complete len:364 (+) Transcript_28723:354-1445(+)